MATRTVRLDDESERVLDAIMRDTGMSVSQALTRGLVALKGSLDVTASKRPYDVYAELDLGEGGWSLASSSEVKKEIRAALGKKHRR